jgi:hypothetical protein
LRALLWPLFPRSAWAQTATVVMDTTVECADLAFFLSVGVSSTAHWGVGDDREVAALASVRLVGVAKPANVVAGTRGEGVALASVRSVVVGSASHSGGGHDC